MDANGVGAHHAPVIVLYAQMIRIICARGSVGAHHAPARPERYCVNIARRLMGSS